MNSSDPAPWKMLFPAPPPASDTLTLRLRLVRKHGHPLLLVPINGWSIAEALALYPAQTRLAKIARMLLRVGLPVGFAPGTEPLTLPCDRRAPLLQFLQSSQDDWICFAILCGNPRVPGRRFILLTFDRRGRPEKIVKVGVGEIANARTRAEAAFLKSIAADVLHAPHIIGEFREGDLEALAFQYAPGKNPSQNDIEPLASLLTSWLDTNRRARLADLPAWQRLSAGCRGHDLFRRLETTLGSAELHPAIHHGDFAPWNVRVHPVTRRWTVLDWERGEAAGPPGWDWFHFVIQSELLVRRAPPRTIGARVEALLRSPAFQAYATAAGIESVSRPLVLAYLLHFVEVTPPAEGAEPARELLHHLAHQW